jgi:hypothetical protein
MHVEYLIAYGCFTFQLNKTKMCYNEIVGKQKNEIYILSLSLSFVKAGGYDFLASSCSSRTF